MAEETAAAADVIQNWERLKGDRGTFDAHYQQATRYYLPDRADYTTERAPGVKRMQYVYNGTPILAVNELAAGLHGLLCSPYLPWKFVECEENWVNQRPEAAQWFAACNDAMDRVFSSAGGSFATATHEFFLDTVSIGTGCMAMPIDDANGVRFACRSMREICIEEGEKDKVDTTYRKYPFTARQALQQWGEAAPAKVKEAAVKEPQKKFQFLHAARPRKKRDPQRADNRNMPVESITVCLDTKEQITESGYPENPFAVCRHSKLSDSDGGYGRCPGFTALPDVKELQEREKMLSKAAQKVIDPPMSYADDAYILRIKTWPGSLNAHRSGTPPEDQLRAIQTGAEIPIGVEMVDRMEQRILRQFYVDWLLMPGNMTKPESDGKGITATYTTIERDQKMRLLSPMLGRYESEALTLWVTRVFNVLWRKSLALKFNVMAGSPFPPPPAILKGRRWHVRYVSPIAVAQRSSSLESIQRLLQIAAGLAQYDPQATQVFDVEGTIRYAGQVMHVPPVLFRSAAELQQVRAANAQAAAAEHAATLAGAAKDGTGAIKNLADAHAAVTPQVAPLAAGGTPTGSRTGVNQPQLLAA